MSKEEKIIIKDKNTNINVSENLNIIEWKFPDFPFQCNIYIEDNIILNSHCLIHLNGINGKINIYSQNKSIVNISLGLIFKNENNFLIKNVLNGNEAYSKILIHALEEDDSKSILKTVGIINEKTKDNEFLEQIKVLNFKKQNITCLPELLVYSNEAIANHNATIRNISIDELFYLNSKGINNDLAIKLIKEGFLNKALNK